MDYITKMIDMTMKFKALRAHTLQMELTLWADRRRVPALDDKPISKATSVKTDAL